MITATTRWFRLMNIFSTHKTFSRWTCICTSRRTSIIRYSGASSVPNRRLIFRNLIAVRHRYHIQPTNNSNFLFNFHRNLRESNGNYSGLNCQWSRSQMDWRLSKFAHRNSEFWELPWWKGQIQAEVLVTANFEKVENWLFCFYCGWAAMFLAPELRSMKSGRWTTTIRFHLSKASFGLISAKTISNWIIQPMRLRTILWWVCVAQVSGGILAKKGRLIRFYFLASHRLSRHRQSDTIPIAVCGGCKFNWIQNPVVQVRIRLADTFESKAEKGITVYTFSDGTGNNIFVYREPIYVDGKAFVKADLVVRLNNPLFIADFFVATFNINEIHSYGKQFSSMNPIEVWSGCFASVKLKLFNFSSTIDAITKMAAKVVYISMIGWKWDFQPHIGEGWSSSTGAVINWIFRIEQ